MLTLIDHGNFYDWSCWGGTHRYYKNEKKYYCDRDSGIFSNLTNMMFCIAFLELDNKPVIELETIFGEYISSENIYSKIFIKNSDLLLDLNLIQNKEAFLQAHPSYWGIGQNLKEVNFKFYNNIIRKFFMPSDETLEIKNNLLTNNSINLEKSVFLWCRLTDKRRETVVPPVSKYIEIIEKNFKDYEIIVQTDDISVLNEIKTYNYNFKFLKEIPIDNSNTFDGCFHSKMCNVDEVDFYNKYKMSKVDYIRHMYAAALIASESKYFICYPGNPVTYVPMLKGDTDNTFLFKNQELF